MTMTRLLLTAVAVAISAFAIWLPINLAWAHPFDKALYGAIFGAVGVAHGFVVARYWFGVGRP